MGGGAGPPMNSSHDPLNITPELLADLQAGLLDDATAARVRSRARCDPEAVLMLARLDTVRRELARLGRAGSPGDAADLEDRGDPGSQAAERFAPDVPASVTARVGAALRNAPHPASRARGGHTLLRPRLTGAQWAGLLVGIFAVATAVILGALILTRDAGSAFPSGPKAAQITVERAGSSGFPLSDAELRAALYEQHDLGPLADPQRRASCLTGLGYSPALTVLGGRSLEVSGRPGLLLLVTAGTADQISAVVVAPSCNAAHTGLLAKTLLTAQ